MFLRKTFIQNKFVKSFCLASYRSLGPQGYTETFIHIKNESVYHIISVGLNYILSLRLQPIYSSGHIMPSLVEDKYIWSVTEGPHNGPRHVQLPGGLRPTGRISEDRFCRNKFVKSFCLASYRSLGPQGCTDRNIHPK